MQLFCSCFFWGKDTKIEREGEKVYNNCLCNVVYMYTCDSSTCCVNICCLGINWIVFRNYSTPCKSLLSPFSSLFRSFSPFLLLHVPTSPPISIAVMVAYHLIYHTVPIPVLLRSLHSPVNAIYVHLPIMNPITSVS